MTGGIVPEAPDRIPVLGRTTDPLPVSDLQRALYLVELLHPGTSMHNVAVALRLEGPLDVPRLRAALVRVVARHDSLRTTFALDDAPPFAPVQRVDHPSARKEPVGLDLVEVGGTDAEVLQAAQASVDEPFDLERGPLLRTRLLAVGPQHHLLVVTMHHLVSDGPSMQVFVDDLADAYTDADADAPERPAPAVQFADYARWSRSRPVDVEALDWWRERLAGAPTVLRLPTDRPHPAVAGTHGQNLRHVLRAEVVQPALQLARDLRVTPFVLFVAAYATFLSRLAEAPEVLVGVPVSARDRVELESVIGYFATTLPVRVAVRDSRFSDLCRTVQGELLDVMTHRDVTMEQLVGELAPERDPARAPLVQAYVGLDQTPVVDAGLPALRTTALDLPPTAAKVDLELSIVRAVEGGDEFDLTLTYRTDLFETVTARRMVDYFERLLVAAVAAPDGLVEALPAPRVDGLAAPAPVPASPPQPAAPSPTAPRTSAQDRMEQDLAGIWREVLGRDDVGPDDNFFDVGGTSFALATVRALIGARTGTTTSLVALLEFPTVATLARHLAGDSPTGPPAAPPGRPGTARLRDRRRRLQTRATEGDAR